MVFEYNLIDNLSKTANSNASTYYFIGALMLIGGLGKLYMDINSEAGFPRMVLSIITLLGGLGFLVIGNRHKKVQKDFVKYSIQINAEKIITKYNGDGSKVKEMLTSDISEIDFNSKDIHIIDNNKNKMVLDLALVSPEKKKKELTNTLENILKNK